MQQPRQIRRGTPIIVLLLFFRFLTCHQDLLIE